MNNPMQNMQAQQPGNPLVSDEYAGAPQEFQGGDAPAVDPEAMQVVLFERVDQLDPGEAQILASIVTPQTVQVLAKILPEMIPLFDLILSGGQQQGPQQPQGGMPPQPAPQQAQAMPVNPGVSRGLMG